MEIAVIALALLCAALVAVLFIRERDHADDTQTLMVNFQVLLDRTQERITHPDRPLQVPDAGFTPIHPVPEPDFDPEPMTDEEILEYAQVGEIVPNGSEPPDEAA